MSSFTNQIDQEAVGAIGAREKYPSHLDIQTKKLSYNLRNQNQHYNALTKRNSTMGSERKFERGIVSRTPIL